MFKFRIYMQNLLQTFKHKLKNTAAPTLKFKKLSTEAKKTFFEI